jgi:hypothetical protein
MAQLTSLTLPGGFERTNEYEAGVVAALRHLPRLHRMQVHIRAASSLRDEPGHSFPGCLLASSTDLPSALRVEVAPALSNIMVWMVREEQIKVLNSRAQREVFM